MPVRYHGRAGIWILQAGSRTTFSEEGISNRTETRKMKGIGRAWSLIPPIGTRHPAMYGLKLVDTELEEMEGDQAKLSVTWEGVTEDELPPPVYTFTRHVTTEPIETHPDFVDEIGGTEADPLNDAVFDPDTGLFDGFPADAANDLGGVSDYFSAGAEYSMRYSSFRRPDDESDVPSIEDPPNAPKLAGDRNWLYIGETAVERGGVFEIELDWMGSGFRAWNELIYGEKKAASREFGFVGLRLQANTPVDFGDPPFQAR